MTGRAVGANDLCTSGIGEVQGITPQDAARAALVAAGLAVRHPCQLDPANGISHCRHRRHAEDREALRTVLAATGLLPDTQGRAGP